MPQGKAANFRGFNLAGVSLDKRGDAAGVDDAHGALSVLSGGRNFDINQGAILMGRLGIGRQRTIQIRQ